MNAVAEHYASISDEDLARLSADAASLTPEASDALRLELQRRGLSMRGINWDALPNAKLSVTEKSIMMRRILLGALAAVLILFLAPRAFAIAAGFMGERYFALGIGFIAEAGVEIATGILILMNHKAAVHLATACAVLLTLDALVGGLSLLGILQVLLAWIAVSWYRSLRTQANATGPEGRPQK